jgi:hypothetical protein
MFITPLTAIYVIIKNNYFSDYMWHLITSSSQSPLYSFTLLFEIFSQSIYIVLPVILIFLAFRYDKRFSKFIIYFYILNLCVNLIDIILASSLQDLLGVPSYGNLAKSIIVASVWIPFFTFSKRCKRIFIK